jgi:type IV secretory pathway TrbF-like protein
VFRAPMMRVSATAPHRVAAIDYAKAQLALAHHVAHVRSQAAHWRRIGIASAGLCLCLGITLSTTASSHVFAFVVEAPAGSVAANFSGDEAAQRHSVASLPGEGAVAGRLLAELPLWLSVGITAARRTDVQHALHSQGP